MQIMGRGPRQTPFRERETEAQVQVSRRGVNTPVPRRAAVSKARQHLAPLKVGSPRRDHYTRLAFDGELWIALRECTQNTNSRGELGLPRYKQLTRRATPLCDA